MHPLLSKISQMGVIPALILDDLTRVGPVCQALLDGHLPLVEVTLRSENALEVLHKAAHYSDDLMVGAGTVYTQEQAQKAVAAGAKYIVSPGIDADLIRYCQEVDVPVFPAAITPGEVMQAHNLGVNCVKFFPSHLVGGLPLIKALAGPFPTMKFLATGGINRETMGSFLVQSNVLAVGGTWMIRPDWIQNNQYRYITEASQETVDDISRLRRPTYL